MPKSWIDEFNRIGLNYEEADSIDDVLPDVDVFYMVGVNPPSFHVGRQDAVQDRPKTPDAYVINPAKLRRAKSDVIILHPLPRKDELPPENDCYSAARYFVQANYGVAVRMALLAMLLGKAP